MPEIQTQINFKSILLVYQLPYIFRKKNNRKKSMTPFTHMEMGNFTVALTKL